MLQNLGRVLQYRLRKLEKSLDEEKWVLAIGSSEGAPERWERWEVGRRVFPAAATIAYYHETEGGLKASFKLCPALCLQLGLL